ncbi:14566_t:CDS:2 [Ambispora leptoticha]|uniref:14566_t:CDS:1 n=1 Tax=Ambispora leptoticha TaxID=144679 RepID=A0A9N9FGN1_9GLOM|nr:14566_t:CDS:2 [Ambispora leptoticha]
MESIEDLSFAESNNSVIAEQEPPWNINLLLNKSYTLYHCTPLYNFNNGKIKNYTNELKEYMLSKETTIGCDNDEQDEFKEFNGGKIEEVKISWINLTGWSGALNKPLGVKILFKSNGRRKEQESLIVILPSIQNEVSLSNSEFTKYPLLLVKALQSTTEIFFEWFQSRFDCRVCRFIIQPYHLRQFVEIWSKLMFSNLDSIEDDFCKISKSIELTYKIPNIDDINNLTVSLSFEDVKRICQGKMNHTGSQEISGILEEIEDHLFRSLHLKLSLIVLIKVGLNSFYVSNDGKLKLFHVPHDDHEQLMIKILEQFIELAEM